MSASEQLPEPSGRPPERGSILEANLALLLRRAHVAVRPAPAFRQALAAELASRARRLGARPVDVRPGRPRLAPRVLALAAGLALALGAFAWWRASRESARPDAPLAQGERAPAPSLAQVPPLAPEGASEAGASPREELVAAPEQAERAPLAAAPGAPDEAPPALAEPEAPASERVRLSGSVRGAGEPLSEFRIGLLRDVRLPMVAQTQFFSFHEARDGRFELASEELAAGRYTLFAAAEGFALGRVGELELAPGAAPEVTLELERGGTLRGRVLERGSGRPIEGALVLSERDAPHQIVPFWPQTRDATLGAWTATDADGRFELRHLSTGAHVLRVSHQGHAPSWSGALEPLAPGAPEGADELVLELGRPARIVGTTRDDACRPRAGAQLVASRIDYAMRTRLLSFASATSDAEGRFALEDLAAGSYVLLDPRQASGGRAPAVRSVSLSEGQTLRVDLPDCDESAHVHGHLRAADGTPLAERDLVAFDERDEQHFVSARTDAEGAYELTLPSGRWYLYAGLNMGRDMLLVGTLDVPAVAELEQELVLGAGAIGGSVRRGREGEAVPEAWVVLTRTDVAGFGSFAGKMPTDAEGRFLFDGLAPGLYSLAAHATGLAPAYLDALEIVADARLEGLELALQPGGGLLLRLRDRRGEPLERIVPRLLGPDGRALDLGPLGLSDASGELRVDGLTPGRWRVDVQVGEDRLAGEVLIEVGRTSELVLAPAATVPPSEGEQSR